MIFLTNYKKKEDKEKKDLLAIFKFNLNENFDEKKKRVKEKVDKNSEIATKIFVENIQKN